MRPVALLLGLGLAAVASAQNPDVLIRLDVHLAYRSEKGGGTSLRGYDLLGRHSIVKLNFTLEPGFQVYVAQRFQRIPGDGDNETLDEYYVEDPGIWRLGKQYLPFGSGELFRESARAARGDTNLVFENLPISIAAVDAGQGRPSGIIGRVGSRFGLSAAVGKHFGVTGTNLTVVRRPENPAGAGRGYRQVFGADVSRSFGPTTVRAEAIALRRGHRKEDRDDDIFDLSATYRRRTTDYLQVGVSRSTAQDANYIRFVGAATIYPNVMLEPIVRFRNGGFYDFGLTLKVRL